MRSHRNVLAAFLGIAGLTRNAIAQDDWGLVPNETIEVAAFLDLSAEALGWNIQYDPALLRGQVTLRITRPLDASALRELVERVLAGLDLTVIDIGSGFMAVVKKGDAESVAVPRIGSAGTDLGLFVIEILEPEHISPSSAVAVLSQLSSGRESSVQVLEGTGYILMRESSSRAKVMLDMLTEIDTPLAAEGLRRVDLKSLTPEQAAMTFMQMGLSSGGTVSSGQDGGASGRVRIATLPGQSAVFLSGSASILDTAERLLQELDAGQTESTRVYSAQRQRASDLLGLIQSVIEADTSARGTLHAWVDNANNAIVVTGPESVHLRVEQLLGLLDRTPASDRRALEAIEIRHRPAEEVLTLLELLLEEEAVEQVPAEESAIGSGDTEPFAAAQDSGGATQARSAELSGRVQLAVDDKNNRLLASGFPADIDRVRHLIKELDIRQPQVFVEVTLVSLTEGQSRDLGVELSGAISSGNTLIELFSLFGLNSTRAGDGSVTPPGAASAGGTGVILDPGDFSAVVRALESVTDGRSVIRPNVLVDNNQTADLDSVVEEPFLTSSLNDGGIATGFGGSSNSGTQISVTPSITAGDQLSIDYSISLSSFTGDSADPALPPPRQTNSLNSSVTIPDGFAVALGGFESRVLTEAVSGTPPLSWIPILGELFKSRSNSASTSRFYVFIRASVSRDEQFRSLKYVSDTLLGEAEINDGWPRTEPRIIR